MSSFPIEDDGPSREPLDVAAENAARRLLAGEEMATLDWEALKAKASSELMDLDSVKHGGTPF